MCALFVLKSPFLKNLFLETVQKEETERERGREKWNSKQMNTCIASFFFSVLLLKEKYQTR